MPPNSPRCEAHASHTGNKRLFPRSRRQQGFATGETTMSIKSWSLCLPPTLRDTRKIRVQPKKGADAGYDAQMTLLASPWLAQIPPEVGARTFDVSRNLLPKGNAAPSGNTE